MTIPETMTAVEIAGKGGPEVLRPTSRPVPQIKPGEVLVAVHAAGVNRPDVLQRMGRYDPPPGASDIPGLECSGIVVAAGAGVARPGVGDAVCALVSGGAYAQYCAVPAGQCLPVPDGVSMVEAATLPETFFTVWSNVFDRGRLQAGETFLVHGGSSGIGTTAIQLAKAFGATVFATAGSAEKCRACERLGADRAIDYKQEDFAAVIGEIVGKRGVDVVLDMVGGDYIGRSVGIMAVDGRHVSIAFLGGGKVALNMVPVMMKRLTLTGSTLRARPVEEKAAIAAALRERVWPLVESGAVKPTLYRSFPLAEAASSHMLMESSEHIGKIALVVTS